MDINRIKETLRDMSSTSDEFKMVVAELLNRLIPGEPFGTMLCDAIMRITVTLAFEAVALRNNDGITEIYLRQRADGDTAYPGEWHVPGSLYRHSESDRNVADRLEQEFGVRIESLAFVDRIIVAEQRGTVHSLIFLVKLEGDPHLDGRHGRFHSPDPRH